VRSTILLFGVVDLPEHLVALGSNLQGVPSFGQIPLGLSMLSKAVQKKASPQEAGESSRSKDCRHR